MWRWFGFALVALIVAAPAQAQDQSAKAFVEEIYKAYVGKDSPAVDISTRKQLDRYFTPPLAQLIDEDALEAAKKQDAPLLGGDPFIDAQDWEIRNVKVAVTERGADRATANVSFVNFDKTNSVRLVLVKTPNGWRVDDIFWPEGSLRAIYKK